MSADLFETETGTVIVYDWSLGYAVYHPKEIGKTSPTDKAEGE